MLLRSEGEARDYVAARCGSESFERLNRFIPRLETANQTQNLISKSSMANVWLRHIADSAQLTDHVPRETSPWVDLGSGAGFPGLIVALMQPWREVVLIESRALRVTWLNSVIEYLGVSNCRVLATDVRRADDFHAAVISARAFARLDRLIAQSARFSTASTSWVLPKGRSASQEVAALPRSLRSMFHVEQSVTDADAGIVVGTGKVEINR